MSNSRGIRPIRPESCRAAVLGGGPVGLEAALQLLLAGYPTTLFEKGDIGENVGRWGHVRLFTPFTMNGTPQGVAEIRKEHPQHPLPGPNDIISGNEFRDSYLIPLALTSRLNASIKTKTLVIAIGRTGLLKGSSEDDSKRSATPFRILTRDAQNVESIEEFDLILDCCGTYGRHAWVGNGGIPARGELAAEKQIAYGIDDILGAKKSYYAGKSNIVVGGGFSAATTVAALAQLAEENSATWTIWLTRGPKSTPLPRNPNDPLRERDRLAAKANNLATRGDGNLEHHANCLIEEVDSHGTDKGFRVSAICNGKPMNWEVDRVIGNVGYLPDELMTRELKLGEPSIGQVHRPEPNYFVLGMKSFGRDSSFLLKRGYEQIQEVLSFLKAK